MTPPVVECDQSHAGISVPDFQAAIDFYTDKLGFHLGFTWGEPPGFAGLNLGNAQIFLSTGPASPSKTVSAVFFLVGDADALYEFHRANGVDISEPIENRAYHMRDYTVRDLNGYYLAFGHRLLDDGPPIPVERVDVTARIEKRLAALLEDLAKHKRLTLGECLEEMILHTNEGVEPHTKATLRYIEELKKKHGIDYDSHGSYRFKES